MFSCEVVIGRNNRTIKSVFDTVWVGVSAVYKVGSVYSTPRVILPMQFIHCVNWKNNKGVVFSRSTLRQRVRPMQYAALIHTQLASGSFSQITK